MLKKVDATARKLGMSRSKLIQTALREFLNCRKAEDVTRRLNESYAAHPPEIDPLLQHLAVETMKRIEWKE
jgi:Ribbon-helix-helix protein, copG family